MRSGRSWSSRRAHPSTGAEHGGREPGDVQFFNTEVGYKYKMSSLQAALGLGQLERIEELVARKRDIFAGILPAEWSFR